MKYFQKVMILFLSFCKSVNCPEVYSHHIFKLLVLQISRSEIGCDQNIFRPVTGNRVLVSRLIALITSVLRITLHTVS